jgi:putative IMPACT (imprinted ancient) family translation regulator
MKQPRFRASDDGEPSHSAGDPILGQIRSHGLTNVAVVVVRYFGGTKLGVGGLVSAYKTAAGEALDKCQPIEIYPTTQFSMVYAYEDTSVVERALGDFEVTILDKEFINACLVTCQIREASFEQFVHKFDLIASVKISVNPDSE